MQDYFSSSTPIVVTCPKRITPYLRREIEQLGYTSRGEAPAGVILQGTFKDAMCLNLFVRTGHRVLFQLAKFSARSPAEMYDRASAIEWERVIPEDGYVSVVSSVNVESVNNSQFANVKCKDAIVDRIRRKRGKRPDSGSDTSRAVVFLYWKNRDCIVYLDTSGESLSDRGYRRFPWKAPMRESLAAAVIAATRWDAVSPFVNPMCGSGTLAIEAACAAIGKAPGLHRENFGFMHVLGYNHDARSWWKRLREKALERIIAPEASSLSIVASDIAPEAVAAARQNAERAGVAAYIQFETCDFSQTSVPKPRQSHSAPVAALNPEYGLRLGDVSALEGAYKAIGDFFKQRLAGFSPSYTGYVFTGNLEAAKKIGLKAKRRIEFYNADIDCRLLEYELYQGSRRAQNP
jgi:putative N6-adenine-specific DNA methylase